MCKKVGGEIKSNLAHIPPHKSYLFCILMNPLTIRVLIVWNLEDHSDTEIIDSNRSGLEKNWVIIALAQDEGCALIAEELEAER
jgi:hypothetical protein